MMPLHETGMVRKRVSSRELCERLAQRFPAHAALEDDEMGHMRADQVREGGDVFGAFG